MPWWQYWGKIPRAGDSSQELCTLCRETIESLWIVMLPRHLPLLLLPGLALVDVDYFWQVGFDQKSSILCWPHTLRIFVIFVITPCTNLDVKLSPRKLFRTVSICDLVYSAIHISVQDYMRFPDASPAFTPPTLFYHGRLLVHWIYWLFRNPSIWCEGHPQSVTSDRRLKRQYTQCSDCRGNTNENIFGPNVSEF